MDSWENAIHFSAMPSSPSLPPIQTLFEVAGQSSHTNIPLEAYQILSKHDSYWPTHTYFPMTPMTPMSPASTLKALSPSLSPSAQIKRPSSSRGRRSTNRRSTKAIRSTKVQKSVNERENREELARNNRKAEDALAFYLGYETPKPQSAGNKNTSGLNVPKIDLHKAMLGVTVHSLQEGYIRAAANGESEIWRQEWRGIIQHHMDADPLEGTFMYQPACSEEPCRTEEKIKGKSGPFPCVTHGTKDWTVCRKQRAEAIFRQNDTTVWGSVTE